MTPDDRPPAPPAAGPHAETAVAASDRAAGAGAAPPAAEAGARLLHELRVHQVQLEMQNQELRRIEQELQVGRRRYFELYDLAPVGLCVIGDDGLVREPNRHLLGLLGVAAAELVERPFTRFIGQHDQDRWYRLCKPGLAAAEAAVGSPRAELTMARPDGTRIIAEVTLTADVDARGAATRRLMVTDVTARHRHAAGLRGVAEIAEESRLALLGVLEDHQLATAALRESEARHRAVAESANDAVVTVDGGGCVVGWNPSAARIFGYSAAEMVGQSLLEVMPPRYRDRHVAGLARARSAGLRAPAGLPYELTGLHRDGHEFPMEMSRARWASGGEAFFTGIIRDITERRRAEADLRLKSAALEAAANPIVITDRTGAITWANPAFSAVTGYQLVEVIGKNPRDLVKSNAHDKAFYQQIWETILAGKTWHGELTNRRKNGDLYPEEMTITPVTDAGGAITHFIAVKRELTEERQLQAQFLQAQKMEAIGILAGGVSHDFNNLLSVILTYTGFVTAELHDGDPMKDDLLEVQHAGERAAALTRQLLAFSRKQVLQPEVLSLNRIATGVEKMLQRILGEDIVLRQTLAADLGLTLADPGQVEQVLMNLVVNARDAMPAGGTLTIATANVEVDEQRAATAGELRPGPYVQLAIADTGTGMDEATRARIFEPFFTTKELGKGTGLGLSTVFGIVKQSRGHVWVDSEPGRGTTFTIWLPCAPAAAPARVSRQPTLAPQATGRETILVVEDQEALLKVVQRALVAAHYRVLTAAHGGDALLQSARHPGEIDLVLTDVVMPGMSGSELAHELAKQRPTCKVLYMSGYTDDAIVNHGVIDPGTTLLAKPFTAAELVRRVREVLDSPVAPRGSAPEG